MNLAKLIDIRHMELEKAVADITQCYESCPWWQFERRRNYRVNLIAFSSALNEIRYLVKHSERPVMEAK